jgi:hypothetical protein
MIIKNKALVRLQIDKVDYKEYIIKKYSSTSSKPKLTRLSDAFKFLAHGLVHKEETGMGATTPLSVEFSAAVSTDYQILRVFRLDLIYSLSINLTKTRAFARELSLQRINLYSIL